MTKPRRHRTLARHLRKAGIDPEVGPVDEEQWRTFYERLEDSFQAVDRERYTVERSIELSSREMEALHASVRADQERLNAIVEALPQAVVWISNRLRIENANGAAWLLFGGECKGSRLVDAIGLYDGKGRLIALPDTVDRLGEGLQETDGFVLLQGTERAASWSLLPVANHGGAILVVNDLTELRRRQADLLHARREAERSNASRESRGRFLANMSHELRTPLNAILGYTELLLEDLPSSDLDRIHRSGSHLLALINDILDLSKIDAGKMEYSLSRLDVAALVEEVFELTVPLAEAGGNELRLVGGALWAMADRTRLAQCMLNLIGNAAKFTAQGTIEVVLRREAGMAVVEVKDSGCGIPAADLERVFEAFAQADAVEGRGTGLGLPLTRALLLGMGGALEASSEVGVGSTFTLLLPLVSRSAEVA